MWCPHLFSLIYVRHYHKLYSCNSCNSIVSQNEYPKLMFQFQDEVELVIILLTPTQISTHLAPSTCLDLNHVFTMVHFYHQCNHWYSSHFELELSIEWSSCEQAFNKGTWIVFLPKIFNLTQSLDFLPFYFLFFIHFILFWL